MRDEFLSEEDLDLANLSEAELIAWWDAWLQAAQVTNSEDHHVYSHGVFMQGDDEMSLSRIPGPEDGSDPASVGCRP